MRVTTAVEFAPDRVLLTARGRSRLYEVNLAERKAEKHMENPSGAATQLAMVKHPYYDFETFPYLILKDTKFISIVDVKERKVFPIIRSQFDMEHLNNNNLGICLLQESLLN